MYTVFAHSFYDAVHNSPTVWTNATNCWLLLGHKMKFLFVQSHFCCHLVPILLIMRQKRPLNSWLSCKIDMNTVDLSFTVPANTSMDIEFCKGGNCVTQSLANGNLRSTARASFQNCPFGEITILPKLYHVWQNHDFDYIMSFFVKSRFYVNYLFLAKSQFWLYNVIFGKITYINVGILSE